MAASQTVQFTAPDNVMFAVAAGLFTVIAISYFVQLWRLITRLKADPALWRRLGQPSLSSLSGQKLFDRFLYQPHRHGVVDPALLREIHRTKFLQAAGVLSFVVALAAFFIGRAGGGA